MINLEELTCEGDNICQTGICKLNKLKKIYCKYNEHINNVNMLSNTLEELECGKNIDQDGISELKKIKDLDCGHSKIIDVNHLADTLEDLNCGSEITQYDSNKRHESSQRFLRYMRVDTFK